MFCVQEHIANSFPCLPLHHSSSITECPTRGQELSSSSRPICTSSFASTCGFQQRRALSLHSKKFGLELLTWLPVSMCDANHARGCVTRNALYVGHSIQPLYAGHSIQPMAGHSARILNYSVQSLLLKLPSCLRYCSRLRLKDSILDILAADFERP